MNRMSWGMSFALLVFPAGVSAAPFDPPVALLCPASDTPLVNKRILLKQLFAYVKISDDLDQGARDITYERRKDALLRPDEFCKNGNSDCAAGVPAKLGQASIFLGDYLLRHSKPPLDTSKGYVLARNVVATDYAMVSKFVNEIPGTVTATCVRPTDGNSASGHDAKLGVPASNQAAGNGKNAILSSARLAIRKNVEDLIFPNNGDKFKGLDPASLSISSDLLKRINSYTVDIALGTPIGPAPFGGGIFGQIVPFVTYNQNYVDGDPKNKSKVFNLGGGITGDVLFPFLGMNHDVQFFPKFVHSFSTSADILTGNLVYTPEPDWPVIGQVYYLIPGTLSVQITPQLIFVYGDVLNDGGDPSLLKTGNFQRLGPKVSFAAYGEGALHGYTYTASFESLKVFQGPLASVSRFETALNYTITDIPAWSFQIKYASGRNLDTLQSQRQLNLGAGLKF